MFNTGKCHWNMFDFSWNLPNKTYSVLKKKKEESSSIKAHVHVLYSFRNY